MCRIDVSHVYEGAHLLTLVLYYSYKAASSRADVKGRSNPDMMVHRHCFCEKEEWDLLVWKMNPQRHLWRRKRDECMLLDYLEHFG